MSEHERLLQAVILAGGLGTRLGKLTQKVPKPMLQVNGKPFLEYEITLLRDSGISDFVLCVGYLGEVIENYFKDGTRFGINIRYSHDGQRLMGPAGALKCAEPLLDELFFVTYGDAYLRADYHRVMKTLLDSRRLGVMVVYENHDLYGKSDIAVKDGYVTGYDKVGRSEGMFWVNFGVTALRKRALSFIPPTKEIGEEEFYHELIMRKELLAFQVSDRFYEIGSPQSLKEFEQFISRRS